MLTNAAGAALGSFQAALPGFLPFDARQDLLFSGPQNLLQLYQDFTTTRGRHTFNFGGSYYYTQDNRTVGAFQNAVAVLGPNLPSALNNLVLGQVSTFATAINPLGLLPGQTIARPVTQPNFNRSISAHDFAFYVSDSWRLRPRVTVNVGLRYDFFGVPRSRNGQIVSNFFLSEDADVFTAVRNGRLLTTGNSPVGRLFESDRNNLAPRLGVAVDLTGDGKTALRAGYGLSYERISGSPLFGVFRNTPNFAVIALTANTGGIGVIPLSTSNFGPLAGTTGTVTLPGFSLNAIARDLETPHVHFWSLALERELANNTTAALQYAGAAGRDLFVVSNINRPGSGAAFLNDPNPAARLNPQFAAINFLRSNGRSNYHALIAELNNSSWRSIGLQFTARYRFAKALDNVSTFLTSSPGSFSVGLLDPFDPSSDYGPADFDVRHRFVGSLNWEVPFERITGDFARQVFGGWEVTGILHARSGTPFTIFNCAGLGSAEAPCPRLVLSGPIDREGLDDPTPDATIPNRFVFIDRSNQPRSGFLNPRTGTADFGPFPAGTTGRNFFRGPGFWNVDAGIHKCFRVTEKSSVQLRAEFYNLFNNPNLFVRPNEVDISSTDFVPVYRSGRRHVQLALKFIF